jgi:hypothetical protein
MATASRSAKSQVLRLIALTFALCVAPSPAQQPRVLAPHKPVSPRLPRHREWDKPAASQTLLGGYWMTDANFKATLYLGNSVKTDPVTVTPILHLSNGVQYTLAPVTLEPSGTAVVNINQALAKQGIAPYATLSGYVEIQYQWPWAAICATVWDVDTIHSLIFTYGLQPPPDPATHGAMAVGQQTQTLEGMWWKQENNVTGFVALSNVTAKPINATLHVTDNQNHDLGDHSVTISPQGTKLVNLSELEFTQSASGGVLLTHDGPDGGLLVSGGLEDERVGYSAHWSLAPLPDASAKLSEVSYAALGLMSGAADPMMSFPAGTVFTPYAVARNVSNQPLTVTPTLWWMQAASPSSAHLAPVILPPHQTQNLDVPALIAGAGLKNFNGSVNLVFDTKGRQGALLLASGSVDQKNTYVFEVVPRGFSESVAKNVSYWSTANGNDTMVTLWNPADEAQDFVFTLFYTGGHYGYPVHLGPQAMQTFNISEIIHNQIPDAEGNVVPAGVQEGSAKISGSQGENEHILVAMDAGVYNVQKATCGQVCETCDGYVSEILVANPFQVSVGGNTQQTFTIQYNTGAQYDETGSSNWSSSNTNVATVSGGRVSGVSVGSVTVSAVYFGSVPVYANPCYPSPPGPPPCPIAYTDPSGSGPGNTTPFVTSISPTWGQVGTTVQVTISGGGFGTAGVVVFSGAGITVTYGTPRNDGTISASFTIAPSTAIGVQTFAVQNNTTQDGSTPRSGPVDFQITPATATPVNFRQTTVMDAGSGDLRFTYAWDSSSGYFADLSACTVGEIVTYPGFANPYPFPSPPFPPDAYSNPTVINLAATSGGFQDDQKLTPSTTFVKPYSSSSFTATQYYRYSCSNYQNGAYVNIKGPLSIVRSVSPNGSGGWEFTVTKSGSSAVINPLP